MQLYTKILIGMAVGVFLGFLVGPNSSLLPNTGVDLGPDAKVLNAPSGAPMPEATGLKTARVVEEGAAAEWLQVEWKLTPNKVLALSTQGVSAKAGVTYHGYVSASSPDVSRFAPLGRSLIEYTEWIGRLFLALIKMVVVPLVFFSLVVGVASLGDFRALGRLGGRTIGYFMVTTVAALVIGVGLANIVQPGRLLSADDRAQLLASYAGSVGSTVKSAAAAPSMLDQLVAIVPTNPVASLANGDMLQVIFFALMLGIALTLMEVSRAQPVVDLFARLNDAMVMLVHVAMALAPYGVAALLFKVVGSTGLSVLVALAVYGVVVIVGLLLHLFVTYGLVVKFGARLPVLGFLGAIKEALLVAFSTSSSSATLPVTMEACEENLNVSPRITSFVLPLGATVNMDGTALYQGVAAIFIAQIYGMDLTVGDQATIVVSATLASVGAAGVPGAGMITLAMVLTAIGVPTEGLALILGVDRLLDMFRTTLNVVGDSTACAYMARLEGDALEIMSDAEDRANPKRGFERRLEAGPHPVPEHGSDPE
ncbi:MAG: dicarboxylate/amino acid:cation symporter [Deltaproteobacteria bacterium]|nr:dicarboxylate/amino acid:cation symporter [Deltaproteobacteria bacterium]